MREKYEQYVEEWSSYRGLDYNREKHLSFEDWHRGIMGEEKIELEHIHIGQYIERNGKFLGIGMVGEMVWTTDLNITTLYSEDITIKKVITILRIAKLNTDNVTLIPVKKVSQYQIGEF